MYRPCPSGAECAGGFSPPVAADGYIATYGAEVFIKCQPSTSCKKNTVQSCGYAPDNQSKGCSVLLAVLIDGKPAIPPFTNESYAKVNVCQEGYENVNNAFCTGCSKGHYRNNQQCDQCPSVFNVKLLAIFFGFLLGGCMLLYGFVRLQLDFKLFIMSVSFLQTMSSFNNIQLDWTGPIKAYLEIASTTNINIEVAQPECLVPMTFRQKWVLIQIFPVVILICYSVTYVVLSKFTHLVKYCIKNKKDLSKDELSIKWYIIYI